MIHLKNSDEVINERDEFLCKLKAAEEFIQE